MFPAMIRHFFSFSMMRSVTQVPLYIQVGSKFLSLGTYDGERLFFWRWLLSLSSMPFVNIFKSVPNSFL